LRINWTCVVSLRRELHAQPENKPRISLAQEEKTKKKRKSTREGGDEERQVGTEKKEDKEDIENKKKNTHRGSKQASKRDNGRSA
jgi:hypothetical protein